MDVGRGNSTLASPFTDTDKAFIISEYLNLIQNKKVIMMEVIITFITELDNKKTFYFSI